MYGRAVMHALSRDAQCEPRNAIRSSQLVFGWRLLIVRSAPLYRWAISLLCFILKGLNAISRFSGYGLQCKRDLIFQRERERESKFCG